MRVLACLLLLLHLWAGFGCDRGAPSARADEDRSHLPRVCAVSPALAQMLVDLGIGETIVGRHRFDAAVPQDIPVVGDQTELDYEMLIAVRPTDVLLQYGERAVPPRLRRLAGENDWNIISFDIDMTADVTRVLESLPTLLRFADDEGGREAREAAKERAAELARLLDEALTPIEAMQGAGSMLLLWSIDPPAAFGPDSFIGDIVERLGGKNAINSGAYPELNLEDILHLDPTTILLFTDDVSQSPVEARLGRLATLDVQAVRGGRLALVRDRQVLIPSTSLLRIVEKIKNAVLEVEQRPQHAGEVP